jgi:hypothetical protein
MIYRQNRPEKPAFEGSIDVIGRGLSHATVTDMRPVNITSNLRTYYEYDADRRFRHYMRQLRTPQLPVGNTM